MQASIIITLRQLPRQAANATLGGFGKPRLCLAPFLAALGFRHRVGFGSKVGLTVQGQVELLLTPSKVRIDGYKKGRKSSLNSLSQCVGAFPRHHSFYWLSCLFKAGVVQCHPACHKLHAAEKEAASRNGGGCELDLSDNQLRIVLRKRFEVYMGSP